VAERRKSPGRNLPRSTVRQAVRQRVRPELRLSLVRALPEQRSTALARPLAQRAELCLAEPPPAWALALVPVLELASPHWSRVPAAERVEQAEPLAFLHP
jgi:hypothetical protein